MSVVPQQAADEIVVRYNTRYKSDNVGLLSILLLAMLGLIAAIVIFMLLQFATNPGSTTFALNKNLQIIEPAPLNEMGITTPALFNWVNGFILDAFSFNYSNQSKQAFKLSGYLNQTAMQNYLDLLANDQDFATISSMKYVVSMRMRSTPIIGDGKEYQGRYAWQIKVPLQVIFSNSLTQAALDVDIFLVVIRVPENESPMGVIIAGFNARVNNRAGAQPVQRGF